MSLSMGPFVRDSETGKMEFIDVELGRQLAGVEVYRQQFWGAVVMHTLGLAMLPTLGERAWLIVENEDLDVLENEAQIIMNNIQLISKLTQVDEYDVRKYADNLVHSIRIARELGGGIEIG